MPIIPIYLSIGSVGDTTYPSSNGVMGPPYTFLPKTTTLPISGKGTPPNGISFTVQHSNVVMGVPFAFAAKTPAAPSAKRSITFSFRRSGKR